MELALNESQQMLQNTVRAFVENELPKDVLVALQKHPTGYSQETWEKAAELGWVGMLIPEQYGGSEGTFSDAAVVYEELGRGPVPGPFFSSGVLGALTVMEAGSDEQKGRILPGVARGSTILTVAITEPNSSFGPQGINLRAEKQGNDYVLNGVKLFVPDATAATHIITTIRTGDSPEAIALLVVDTSLQGVSTRTLPGFISWQSEVEFQNVRVSANNLLGGESTGWAALSKALEKATPILCAYEVGGCQAVFDMSVTYSQTRVQFGVPIGRFQRVQDHIVKLVNHLDSARWTTNEALWKLDSGRPATASVHMAKAVASEAYLEACNAGHEVHAGMGSSNEYGLVKHTQMSRTLFHVLGDPKWHKRRMADALNW